MPTSHVRRAPSGLRRAAAALLLSCAAALAPAQQASIKTDPQFAATAPLLRDFIHFTLIDRPEIAASYAQQLMDAKLSPRRFVELLEASGELERFENVIPRALKRPELEKYAAQLQKHYAQGRLDRVRDPAEIKRNVALLKGLQRQHLEGRRGLVSAGEYAVPQLLDALVQRTDSELSSKAKLVLTDMGRQAVVPLCTALPDLDSTGQQAVAEILGRVPYRTSVPFLADLRATTQSDSVRTACQTAIDRLGGATSDAAAEFAVLADHYYSERADLTSFPGEEYQLYWTFRPETGLFPVAVRTPVFHEAMAMRCSERSLTLRPESNEAALVTWLAANFSREIDTPREYVNPVYPATRRDAMYYAVAAGATPCQQVLARALDDRDTPLARRSIAAIEQTAGGATLWNGIGSRRPLLEAVRYPNRRVQYEAALALGAAQPTSPFDGSDRVVPILASAIRDADDRFAVIIMSEEGDRASTARGVLEGQGYTVLPRGGSLGAIAQPIADAPGIDVIVSELSQESTLALVSEARNSRSLAATPMLCLTSPQAYIDLDRRFKDDVTIAVRPNAIGTQEMGAAVQDLVDRASGGPITRDEARAYQGRCLATLRDLAVSGNQVLSAGDAAPALIAALGDTTGPARLSIADVLSRINQKRAQVALMDAALAAAGPERVALVGEVSDSAKRFGNLLETRQVDRVVEMAGAADTQEATAAAALVGSLNLPNANLIPLILGTNEGASRSASRGR